MANLSEIIPPNIEALPPGVLFGADARGASCDQCRGHGIMIFNPPKRFSSIPDFADRYAELTAEEQKTVRDNVAQLHFIHCPCCKGFGFHLSDGPPQ